MKTERIITHVKLPEINERIKFLIKTYSKGNVAQFVKLTDMNSHQILNRIFNIDTRNNKYPKPSGAILTAIQLKLPEVNYNWLLTGEGEIFNDKHVDKPNPTPELNNNLLLVDSHNPQNSHPEGPNTYAFLIQQHSLIMRRMDILEKYHFRV